MTAFERTIYNFNDRFILNDEINSPDAFALIGTESITDTLAINTEEQRPTEPGIVDFGTQFGKGEWEVPLTLYATSVAKMNKLIQDLKEAFNPDLLEMDATYGESTLNGGYHPLDWEEDIDGTVEEFRMYIKSMETPAVPVDTLAGSIRKCTLKLKARDPRKYSQTPNNNTSGAAVSSVNVTNTGTYTSPPRIVVNASGATSTSLTITNSTTGESIFVTTALSNGQKLEIDIFNRSVKLDGVEKRSMLGGNSIWWSLAPGVNNISFSNKTNAQVQIVWRDAWPL